MARPIQEINAGSMADIAFLLLIFFLVTTTMDVDSGIPRRLPPPEQPDQEQPPPIKERNVYIVQINSDNRLAVEGDLMQISDLCEGVKKFITNRGDNENLSEKVEKDNFLFGKTFVSKGVVSLQNDRNTSYEKYIEVQNELVKAFNELKNELSQEKFQKNYNELDSELDEDKIKAIKDAIPVTISEAEPNIGG